MVYPEIIKLSTFNIGASHQLGGLHVHDLAYEDRSRISTIREYREGDSIKSIHWKLSAKRDVPIIKDYEKRGDASTIILLDNEVSHFENDIDRRLEDKAVEATLGIIDYCLNHDINILIQTQDEEDYIELQGEQPSDIRPFLETLAKFKGNGSSDFRNIIRTTVSDFNNTSTIIIISPKLNKDIGAEGINLKFKNLNPIFIAITDIENNINYIDEMVEERLRKEGIPLYILDYNTDTKEALEGYYGFGKK